MTAAPTAAPFACRCSARELWTRRARIAEEAERERGRDAAAGIDEDGVSVIITVHYSYLILNRP